MSEVPLYFSRERITVFPDNKTKTKNYLTPWPSVAPLAERESSLLTIYWSECTMIRWTGLGPWESEFPFTGSLTSTFLQPLATRDSFFRELAEHDFKEYRFKFKTLE